MSLSPGEKLGPYEILAPIGKGGMGEVYRACDTRLNRDVAIKISAERFTERFEREARAIASLNHPNICHLYDVGPNYLVMELVEGPTLADRIKQGGIPLEEALNIACQIADALEAAHEKGITHRDLKPGNINIKPDGTVKVLDFGLAKMGGTPTVQSDHSPTITVNHTEAGVILGTAAYMSPEQAKGKPVDQRADIYAFGAVLYEMLTHTRLHHGETTTEVLASVIKEEPRWDKVPAQVRRLLRRCLEKDPQKRLRHIGDVMALLDDEVAAPSSVAAQPARKARRIWPSIAALLFVVGTVFVFIHFHETPRTALEPVRFKIPLPEKTSLVPSGAFSVSPDGRKVVFAAGGSDGTRQLWVRTLDSLEAHPLPGVEIGNPPPPFWSPDSRFVAYNSGGKLNKVDVAGGPPQALCDLPANTLGGSWNRDGVIIFGTTQGLMRVSAAGGATAAITALDASRKDFAHVYPTFLPDGKHFLYLRYSADPANSGVYVGSLDAKATEQSTKQLVATEYGPVYAPSMDGSTGHLLFLRQTC
jgi:serine/threonine protein kinase